MKHSDNNNAGEWSSYILHRKHLLIWIVALAIPLLFIHLTSYPLFDSSTNSDDGDERVSGLEDGGSGSSAMDFHGNHLKIANNQSGECDLSTGEWIPDPSGPFYTNATCNVIQDHQNCMKNGRPDTGYLHWRWKPKGCELPRFDGSTFLELVRGKSLAFIGDSIGRNHMQSLLCLLSQVEVPTDVYRDSTDKFRRWYFPSYKFTLAVLWSPFWVKEVTDEIKGVDSNFLKLQLDVVDENWTSQLNKYDIVLLSGGQWFLKSSVYLEKGGIIGCHGCPGTKYTEVGFYFAYRKALRLAFKTIYSSKSFKGLTLLRTFTPDHFENGQWHNGGKCNRKVPYKNHEVVLDGMNQEMYNIQLQEFENAAKAGAARGLKFKLVPTTWASIMRPDGHPGQYRENFHMLKDKKAKVQNDCLHWCLPGPIDTWSEFLLESLKREFQ